MKRQEAFALLGIVGIEATRLSELQIAERFATAVKAAHPDNGGKGGDLDKIKQARDFLLKNLAPHDDFACVLCQGRGIVQRGMGWWPCVACKGTGEKR